MEREEREREVSHSLVLSLQMPGIAGTRPGQSQEPETQSGSLNTCYFPESSNQEWNWDLNPAAVVRGCGRIKLHLHYYRKCPLQ